MRNLTCTDIQFLSGECKQTEMNILAAHVYHVRVLAVYGIDEEYEEGICVYIIYASSYQTRRSLFVFCLFADAITAKIMDSVRQQIWKGVCFFLTCFSCPAQHHGAVIYGMFSIYGMEG